MVDEINRCHIIAKVTGSRSLSPKQVTRHRTRLTGLLGESNSLNQETHFTL